MSAAGKAFDFSLLRRIFKFVMPYKPKFYVSVVLTIAVAVVAAVRPMLVQYTFDHYIMHANPQALLYMILLMVALLFMQSILQYAQVYITNWLGQTVVKDLRVSLYKRLLGFKLQYFDKTPVGVIITRTISDMESISDIFSEGLIAIIGDILLLSVVIGIMLYTDWRLTLVSLSTIPLLLIATNVFKNGIKSTFNEVRTQVANLSTFVQEHITGMSVVQIFNREEQELAKFVDVNQKHRDANIRSVWYYSVFFPVVEILSAASLGLMVWWGAKEALHNHVSIGNMIAFIMYINMLFRPIREMADKINTLQMGMVSCERVFKVLDTDAFIKDTGHNILIGPVNEISFKDVWFAYNEEQYVLRGINLQVNEGETIALVGATGAGKSSVINILSRFYEINKGSISINEVDARDYTLNTLRGSIATVLQDVFLFSDTVLNNITLKEDTITEQAVIVAAKAIGAHDFIMRLPGGYHYNVQERGATLSVGQRQLISFIRAYVRNPKILVLDEATSSIDTESEQLIQYATDKITENRTSIVIAHRLATIQRANRIYVLDHGQVVEHGTHQELLKQNGTYKKLYELQFQKEVIT